MTIDPAIVVATIGALAAGLGTVLRLIWNDLRAQRDDWKAIAQGSQRDVGRLTTLLEDKLDIKVPPAP